MFPCGTTIHASPPFGNPYLQGHVQTGLETWRAHEAFPTQKHRVLTAPLQSNMYNSVVVGSLQNRLSTKPGTLQQQPSSIATNGTSRGNISCYDYRKLMAPPEKHHQCFLRFPSIFSSTCPFWWWWWWWRLHVAEIIFRSCAGWHQLP